MASKASGVENRGTSIRLSFVLVKGEPPVRKTLTINGEPMKPTPANLRYAERIAAEIRDKVRLGAFRMSDYFEEEAGPSMLLAALMKRWLGAQRIEGSTKAGYGSAIKFWTEATIERQRGRAVPMGSVPINEVLRSDILTVIAGRADLSGKTINNYASVLREAFQLAVEDGLLADNPAGKIPRARHQSPPPDPFSLEETEAVIAYCAAKFPGQIHNLVEAWFFGGYRTSEIAGMKWPSIDFRRNEVLVHEALVRGVEKDKTKTGVARLVKLNSRAMAAIKRQKAHTFLAGEHVFVDPRNGGAWIEERAFRRSYWTPALKSLGIRYRRPYQMRHTFATMMLMSGATPAWCAKQMGHSIEMFLRTYAKWIDGAHDDLQMQRLETFIAGPAGAEGTGT